MPKIMWRPGFKRASIAAVCFLALCFVLTARRGVLSSGADSHARPGATAPHLDPAYSAAPALIPRVIWQNYFAPDLDVASVYASEWVSQAPGYTYTMLRRPGSDDFVDTHFGNARDATPPSQNRGDIVDMYRALTKPASKSDFLRYLILLAAGGYYSDVDTKPVAPVDSWIPAHMADKARLVVALEHDDAIQKGDDWKYPVQFCQWTMAAAPNHPVLSRAVARALQGLQDVADAQGVTTAQMQLSNWDVLNTTGPIAWTEAVFEGIQVQEPEFRDLRELSGLAEPRLFGDILVLPFESFQAEPLDEWGLTWGRGRRRTLVRHYFSGSWRLLGR